MANFRAMVKLQKSSNTPEDVVMNTLYFTTADPASTTITNAIAQAISDFYAAIDGFMSSQMATSGHTVTFYDMGLPEPRVPFSTVALSAPSTLDTTALPAECAACLSFQGTRSAGTPQARRRGRIFIGCLGQSAKGSGTGAERLASGFATALAGAGDNLLAASVAAADWSWVVHSPTANNFVPVVDGWVDNAFDTVRSRGTSSTVRTLFS